MLKALSVTNFMALEKLELEFTAPVQIFAGQNEAGKSSIRDSILWLFTGTARGLKTHSDQAALIKEGAKFTEVSALLADGRGFTRRKTAKTAAQVMGDIPEIGLSPAILFDPYVFLGFPEDQRRELLFKVIPGLHPTGQNVFDRLMRWPAVEAIEDIQACTVPHDIAKMAASHGFPGAEKECVSKRREAKRVRDEYKGATEPEKTLTIDGQEFDIPTLNLPAIDATLKDLQVQKDDLLRQKGAGEARVKRLATINLQLAGPKFTDIGNPGTANIGKIEDEIRFIREAIELNAKEIKQANVKSETFPATCPVISLEQIACPNAGQKVGVELPAPGILETLSQNLNGLVKKLETLVAEQAGVKNQVADYQSIMAAKTRLEEEQTRLQTEPETGANLDAEIATRQRRIDRGVAFDRAVHDYNLALERYQDTLAKLAAAEQEVIIYDALQKALAPDGIPSQMIAEALDGINELLEDAASYFFPGRYLHLTGELGIVLQNSPYITLSKSAKYRVGVAFQFALSRLTGARILLIDEMDILDTVHQLEMLKFLSEQTSNYDQIMVFMTSSDPPTWITQDWFVDGNLQVWWLQDGKVTPLQGA